MTHLKRDHNNVPGFLVLRLCCELEQQETSVVVGGSNAQRHVDWRVMYVLVFFHTEYSLLGPGKNDGELRYSRNCVRC